MGIEIKIKQPRNKVDIFQLEKLWKSACTNAFESETCPRIGVLDEFYRMRFEFISTSQEYEEKKMQVFGTVNDYLLFDQNNYGSGIQLWFDNENNICLKASFPTTYSEIISLYKLVNVMCNEFGTKEFYRGSVGELELVDISQLNWFVELGINDSLVMLENMKRQIEDGGECVSINGVVNFLSIELDNLKSWGIDLQLVNNMENITTLLYNYEKFMNEIQQRDLFYAVFKLYQIKQDKEQFINGYISMATDTDTILPKVPESETYFIVNQYDTSKINKFYVILEDKEGESCYVEYGDFLNKIEVEKREKYDAKHFIVRLSVSDIEEIIKK